MYNFNNNHFYLSYLFSLVILVFFFPPSVCSKCWTLEVERYLCKAGSISVPNCVLQARGNLQRTEGSLYVLEATYQCYNDQQLYAAIVFQQKCKHLETMFIVKTWPIRGSVRGAWHKCVWIIFSSICLISKGSTVPRTGLFLTGFLSLLCKYFVNWGVEVGSCCNNKSFNRA